MSTNLTDHNRVCRAILADRSNDDFITKLLRAREYLNLPKSPDDRCRGLIASGFNSIKFYCTECGFEIKERHNFCPHCGAEIKEEGEE